MGLKAKISLPVIIVSIFAFIVFGVNYHYLNNQFESIEYRKEGIKSIESRIKLNIKDIIISLQSGIMTGEDRFSIETARTSLEVFALLEELENDYSKSSDSIRANYTDFYARVSSILAKFSENRDKGGESIDRINQISDNAYLEISRDLNLLIEELEEEYNNAISRINHLMSLAVIMFILLVLVLIFILIPKFITDQIKESILFAKKIARGTLRLDYLEEKSLDEIGELNLALNKMYDSLRKESEYRVKLENLIKNISNQFIDLREEDIRASLEKGLKSIGAFIDVDYSYIKLFSDDGKEVKDTFSWSKSCGNNSYIDLDLTWILERFKEEDIIDISNLDKLPREANGLKEDFLSRDVKSSIILALKVKGSIMGIISFDSISEDKDWKNQEFLLFELIRDIFINVLKRKENENRINDYYEELEMQNMELEKVYQELEGEFEKGSKLHQQFLPSELPDIEGISYSTYFQPSARLGGDFYNIVRVGDQLLVYLADVSGHGLDGSLLNIFLRETINNYLLYRHKEGDKLRAAKIISYVSEKYRNESFPADYFICLLVGILDLKKMNFSFANAGFQIPPIIISNGGLTRSLSCGGMPISSAVTGRLFDELYTSDFDVEEVYLEEGDNIFLTTDGLIEEVVGTQMYGEDRLKEVLSNNYCLPSIMIKDKVKDDFKNFAGTLTGQDDITFVNLKRDFEIIDSFEKVIDSELEEMYLLKEELLEFLKPYYQPPSLICIGFQEMLTNAIEHGNKMDSSKKVFIRVEVNRKYIMTVIRDEGDGFDWRPKMDEEFDIEADFNNLEDRGRGIKISNRLYDKLCYNKKGNEVYLYKLIEK